jgi:hypothetical protein
MKGSRFSGVICRYSSTFMRCASEREVKTHYEFVSRHSHFCISSQTTHPCNILYKPLTTDPGLETCSVQATSNSNSIEVNVRDIGELALALSEGADRQACRDRQ